MWLIEGPALVVADGEAWLTVEMIEAVLGPGEPDPATLLLVVEDLDSEAGPAVALEMVVVDDPTGPEVEAVAGLPEGRPEAEPETLPDTTGLTLLRLVELEPAYEKLP